MCHLCMSIKANQLYCNIPHSKFPCYMYLCSPQVSAKQCCKVITACLQVHVHAHMKEGPIHYTTKAHKNWRVGEEGVTSVFPVGTTKTLQSKYYTYLTKP